MTTETNNKMSCTRKTLLFVVAPLVVLALVGVVAFLLATRSPAQRQSQYLTMSDGTQIAVDVWLPADLEPGQKVPTMLRAVRYWRSYQPGPMARIVQVVGVDIDTESKAWAEAGYGLVTVDVRGSGASYGEWYILWSAQEIADLGEVVDWIVAQPWSNGRVGAYGVSYDGNTAEMTAALNHPAVKAVAPQYGDFDVYTYLLRPGGLFNRWFIEAWQEFTRRLDANDVCILAEAGGVDCRQIESVITGVRPVDGDADGAQLNAAIAGRRELDLVEIAEDIEYSDDEWASTEVGGRLFLVAIHGVVRMFI